MILQLPLVDKEGFMRLQLIKKKENFLKIQQFWKIYLIYVFFLIFKIKSESNRIKSLKLYFSS